MNSLDRVMLAINFEKTDRVTVDLHNFLVTCEYSGLPYNEVFTSGEKLRTHKSRCGKDWGMACCWWKTAQRKELIM